MSSSTFLSIAPNLVLSPFPRTLNPLLHRTHQLRLSHHTTPFLRGNMGLVKAGFNHLPFSDPEVAEGLIRDLFGRAEGLFYTVADAAVSASPETVTASKSNDWLSGITNYMEFVLKVLKDGLSAVHVPYSYGFAIILLTVLVKAATFPLTKKQVESSMAMRSLQPQIKAIQQRYAGDQEKIQLETARIYKLADINPLAGCLPTLATIPVWIGLYRALSNVADEGLLTEGFFWIPSLAGPTTIAARQSGSGISWLFPFVDGHPPLGWSDTFAYLVLPVLLVLSQYISVQIMQSSQSNDPNMKSSQVITKLLPLMIGYFSLSVPSGLSLYWFTNNILSTAQQVWLQKLGGAKDRVSKITDSIIKEDRSEIQKTTLETTTTVKEPRAEQSTSGPRPGERFRQLKEQEEKRKRQKEEERRRAEEVAANATQVTNGAPNKKASSVQSESNIVNGNGNSTNGIDPSSRIISSNGDLSTLPSKDDPSILEMDEDEGNGQHLHENAGKDAVGTAKASSEDPTGDRSE